jgi:hypothetical protein
MTFMWRNTCATTLAGKESAKSMDVFDLRDRVIRDYERFTRSFAKIEAGDIKTVVDQAYDQGRFWPSPLIQLNPSFEPGGTIDQLVDDGTLDDECRRIFWKKDGIDDKGYRECSPHRARPARKTGSSGQGTAFRPP